MYDMIENRTKLCNSLYVILHKLVKPSEVEKAQSVRQLSHNFIDSMMDMNDNKHIDNSLDQVFLIIKLDFVLFYDVVIIFNDLLILAEYLELYEICRHIQYFNTLLSKIDIPITSYDF